MHASDEGQPQDGLIRLTTLGGAVLSRITESGESQLVLGAGKPLALITYLNADDRLRATKERVVDLLWADVKPDAAKHDLRQTLWYIRRRLGEHAIITDDGELVLGAQIESDVRLFLHAAQTGDLDEAVELYGGDFLTGLELRGGTEFERWAERERHCLRRMFIRVAEDVARNQLSTGRFREAKQLAQRVRDADVLNESGWRLLLETLLTGGDSLGALVEADRLEEMLRSEGREAEQSTTAMVDLVQQQSRTQWNTETDGGLEAELVGREAAFEAITDAWEHARNGFGKHLHVTASAGMGKSRLLDDVMARLRATGAKVVHLHVNPASRQVPYAFAAELAGELGRFGGATGVAPAVAGTLVDLNPVLSSLLPVKANGGSGPDTHRLRFIALAEQIHAITDDGPLAMLIDDVHLMDAVSRQLLGCILGKVEADPLLVVTTAEPNGDADEIAAHGEALALRSLRAGDIEALMASVAEPSLGDWPEELPSLLCDATGGSPKLVLEALEFAIDRRYLELRRGKWRCLDVVALARELEPGGALGTRCDERENQKDAAVGLAAPKRLRRAYRTLSRAFRRG